MSRWLGKYVIALTGNIATGKSVVRKMLEHLGASSIDADALSHQALAKGGPAYAAVTQLFGEWIVTPQGDVDRARLGKIVFNEPEALHRLEAIIHPFVGQAIDVLVKRAKASLVVIEAIKVIESGTAKDCDALWVVTVPEAVQEIRLVEKRKMHPAEARQRVAVQPPQAEKVKAASFVIDNSGTFEDTWMQVQAGFNKIAAANAALAQPQPVPEPAAPAAAGVKTVQIRRGKPSDANQIAAFIKHATNGQRSLSRGDVIAAFGDKAYMLADYGGQLAAIAGWKVENLVARVDEVYLAPEIKFEPLAAPLFEAVESASKELQCEAALLFVPLPVAQAAVPLLGPSGYIPQKLEDLKVDAWRDAAKESMPAGTAMFFKKLREDRVLRPV